MPSGTDAWASGDAYEPYVGRWSRLVAAEFLSWLGVPTGGRWLDVGCGTGALIQTILRDQQPRSVDGVDSSAEYVSYAREQTPDRRVSIQVANGMALPFPDESFDVAVSGLVLNFVPRPIEMVSEQRRVTRSEGVVGAYVWDYADQMQLMRLFWDAAVALDPEATALDEGRRFPLCQPEPLAALFTEAGLSEVEVRAIEVPTNFQNFDDFWQPFLGGQGPAPGYVMSLDEERRITLREQLRATLPTDADGAIQLVARAWAVRGRR